MLLRDALWRRAGSALVSTDARDPGQSRRRTPLCVGGPFSELSHRLRHWTMATPGRGAGMPLSRRGVGSSGEARAGQGWGWGWQVFGETPTSMHADAGHLMPSPFTGRRFPRRISRGGVGGVAHGIAARHAQRTAWERSGGRAHMRSQGALQRGRRRRRWHGFAGLRTPHACPAVSPLFVLPCMQSASPA